MSNHLTSEVYKRQVGGLSRNAVMVLLADKASDDGSGIWASKSRMAAELGCSKQTVIDVIKGLIDDGLLIECGHRSNPNGYTVEYAINVDALRACPLVAHHADQSSSLTGQKGRPVKSADVTSQAARPHRSSSLTQTPLNLPKPPEGCAREARTAAPDLDLEDDWSPPVTADLPAKARALVEQWPAGAYEAVCERFRLYWSGADRTQARLARWLMDDHGKVMRDAKAGVSFAALAPPRADAAARPARPYPVLKCKKDEPPAALGRKALIRDRIGANAFARFIRPAVLLPADDGHRLIVGSEFHRTWIEQNLLSEIALAIGKPVRIEVEGRPPGAAG